MSFFKKAAKKLTSFGKGSVVGGLAGAAIAGPVGAVAGGLLGGYASYSSDSEARKQKKALASANAYDKYLWDLSNQYNDPASQMARLKAAGLNPNLVYGSSNVTGNTTGTAGSNGVLAGNGDFVARGLSVAQGFANLRNTNSQNDLLSYQMGQTAAQTAYTEAKARDLNNFLDGTGNSTFNRYRDSKPGTPSVPETTLEDDVIELAPKNARPILRRAAKHGSKYVSVAINPGEYLRNPVKEAKEQANDYIYKKSLDKLYRDGKISKQRYYELYYF